MPKARLRAVSHEERIPLVDHLDELRWRIIVSVGALFVAAGIGFWQDERLLEIANRPLPEDVKPTTLAVGEPFLTTLTVAVYAGLLVTLPIIAWQIYAYVVPAFTPREKRVAAPLLAMVPFLFFAGVAFSYFVVVPNAADFLLEFNASEFEIQVRARDYYSFLGMALLGVGLLFQLPIAMIGITRLGIVSPDQLAENRRYAILAIAVVAMLLPGQDPITMLLAMLPLVLLFELSLLLTRWLGRERGLDEEEDEADEAPDSPDPTAD